MLFAVLGVFAVAGLGFAATPRTRAIEHVSPEKFKNIIIEPAGECQVDFGLLTNAPNTLGTICRESAACVATGCAINDACIASSRAGGGGLVPDGGDPLPALAVLSCRAATDAVYFRLCLNVTDGGTLDLLAENFKGRCIH